MNIDILDSWTPEQIARRERWAKMSQGVLLGELEGLWKKLEAAEARASEAMEVIKAAWPLETADGWRCKFCDAPTVGNPDDEVKHTPDCILHSIRQQVSPPASGLSSVEAQHNPASFGEEDGGKV